MRPESINNLFLSALILLSCAKLSGQDVHAQDNTYNPVYKRGETVLESTLPPSPESASRVKYADVPFTHCLGLAEYEVPFSPLQGRELSFPTCLYYRSGGIRMEETAGVAGLGWTLEAGGCVTRTVMDMPDEFVSEYGRMIHQMPSDTEDPSLDYLSKVVWHRIDAQLDMYKYSVCGLSGSFVIKDDGTIFLLGGDGVKVTYVRDGTAGAPLSFTLVGPDGTKYVCSEREYTAHDGYNYSSSTPLDGEKDIWSAVTSWHVTEVQSRSGLEKATFSYMATDSMEIKRRSRIDSFSLTSPSDYNTSSSVSTPKTTQIFHPKVLTKISLGNFSLHFSYSGGTGYDRLSQGQAESRPNFPVRLDGISLRHTTEDQLDSLAVDTAQDIRDGRIILKGLRRFRHGVEDDRWDFAYYASEYPKVNRSSKDWFGYYNAEYDRPIFEIGPGTGPGDINKDPYVSVGNPGDPSGESSRIPEFNPPFETILNTIYEIKHGFPSEGKARYMSLRSADHDGVKTTFEYEQGIADPGNTSSDGQDRYNVGIRVSCIKTSAGQDTVRYRYFSYSQPMPDGPVRPSLNMYTTVAPPQTQMISGTMTAKTTWTFSVHDNPVTIGSDIQGTKVYWGKITETVSDRQEPASNRKNIAKTVYYYNTEGVHKEVVSTAGFFPEAAENVYDNLGAPELSPWTGIQQYYYDGNRCSPPRLKKIEQYEYDGTGYGLKESLEYEYEPETFPEEVMTGYIARQVNTAYGFGNLRMSDIYHFPIMTGTGLHYRPNSILTVGYHNGGNDSTRVTMEYVRRESLDKPERIAAVSCTEGGVQRYLEYIYPDTYQKATETEPGHVIIKKPDFDPWFTQLCNQHFYTTVLKKHYYISAPGNLPDTPLRSEQRTYTNFWITNPLTNTHSAIFDLKEHKEYYKGNECWKETVLSRNLQGRITSVKEKGQPLTGIVWGFDGLYPVRISQDSLTTHFNYRPGTGLVSTTDPSGIYTQYEYDHANRLTAIKDGHGRILQSWNYHLFNNGGDGHLSRTHRVFRDGNGLSFSEDTNWWDVLGLKEQDLHVGGAGDGRNLVVAYESDGLLRDDARTWLPYAVTDTCRSFRTNAPAAAAAFHDNARAYYARHYENSKRDRVISEALPGYDGEHETSYTTDVCATPFPIYQWDDDSAIVHKGSYRRCEVLVNTMTDADGRTVSTFSDHFGRTLATRTGTDSLTYYIYDTSDMLRAVAGGGIPLSDTLSMWRYSYDSLGRLASKGVPGCVREYYTYDNEDRIIAVRRGEYLTEKEYDSFGRPVKEYLTEGDNPKQLIGEHTYTLDRETGARYAVLTRDPDEDYPYVSYTYQYDDRGRNILTTTAYPDNSVLTENTVYNLAGEILSRTISHNGRTLSIQTERDSRGRETASSSVLSKNGIRQSGLCTRYHYDSLGRACGKTASVPNGMSVKTEDSFTLQGWPSRRNVYKNDILSYTDYQAFSYMGLVSGRSTKKYIGSGLIATGFPDIYTYDNSGRLCRETRDDRTTGYLYDSRGNILERTTDGRTTLFSYEGDKLSTFGYYPYFHDNHGRMLFDGMNEYCLEYNVLNLPKRMEHIDCFGIDINYIADGTKLDIDPDAGVGLHYRGPFVYRSTWNGDIVFESASCPEGRLTDSLALLYVTDFLGSVRSVMDADDGTVYEESTYSAFGGRSYGSHAKLPDNLTLRDHFTGCEDMDADFNYPYSDHSARYYYSTLQRWMVPDPLSEKYYGISPYAYCNNNPLSFVDLDGNRILDKNGNEITYDPNEGWSSNITDEQRWYFTMLMCTDTGNKLLSDIMNSVVDVYIDFSDGIVHNKENYVKGGQNAIYTSNGLVTKSEVTLYRNGMLLNYPVFEKKHYELPYDYYKAMIMVHELQHLFNWAAFPEISDSKERAKRQEEDSDRKMLDFITELSMKLYYDYAF